MTGEPFERETPPLQRVREGMTVYDRNDEKVGSVEEVFFGATGGESDMGQGPQSFGAADRPTDRDDGLLEDVARAFVGRGDELPETVRNRLLRNGYIRVDGGILGKERYVVSDQIASVGEDRVTLSVSRDELLTD